MMAHLLAAALALLASEGTEQAKLTERLQGSWTVISYEQEGLPLVGLQGATCNFNDETFTFIQNDELIGDGEYTVDEAQLNFDITLARGDFAGRKQLGIVSLEEDYLLLCLSKPGTDRPKLFDAAADSNSVLIVLKRTVEEAPSDK